MNPIEVRGARQHNLKNIDVTIPTQKLVVITGPSGAGKSSLAYDVIYAEAQRRYVECVDPFTRQLLGQLPAADVDTVTGLPPALSVRHASGRAHPRSTVGTLTEVHDYLRLLFARVGRQHCSHCGSPVNVETEVQIADRILDLSPGTRLAILAPNIDRLTPNALVRRGFVRAMVAGAPIELESLAEDAWSQDMPAVDVFVDRIILRDGIGQRLLDSLRLAAGLGRGQLRIAPEGTEPWHLTTVPQCLNCGAALPELSPQLFSFSHALGACPSCHGTGAGCPACDGTRLRPEARAVTIHRHNIASLSALPCTELDAWCATLTLTPREQLTVRRVMEELRARLAMLLRMALGHLTLARPADSLSGGESERVALTTQLSAGLVGVLYVLDEPTSSLHPRDAERLLTLLQELTVRGNTLLVVEHDPETLRVADWIIELGPEGGKAGGHVTAQGTPTALQAITPSETAHTLGATPSRVSRFETSAPSRALTLEGAALHNLKNLTVDVPLGGLVAVTGPSGSGKSSLVLHSLVPLLQARVRDHAAPPGLGRLRGGEHLEHVIHVDQSPLNATARSAPVTIVGAFQHIRTLFTELPEARTRGYEPRHFSFNAKGGRCERCEGAGVQRIEMQFLPPVSVPCDVCHGMRFARDMLDVRFRGKHIGEVLSMSADDAHDLFAHIPPIARRLSAMKQVGAGYLTLGQPASTLSSGEAQRLKLAAELAKSAPGPTLYVFDEPTRGLCASEIDRLTVVFHRLVDESHSVIVIEHSLRIIRQCDWVIDLGPEGGDRGGELLAVGMPRALTTNPRSVTGPYL